MARPRRRVGAALLAGLLGLLGCNERRVVLSVSGAASDVASLRATVTLSGREARPIAELPGDATLVGLELPEVGPLVVELDGLSSDRCSMARGAVTAYADRGTLELSVPLRRLAAPSCCSPAGWCWDNPLPTGADLRKVWGLSADDLWIVGEDGGLWHYTGRGLIPVPLPTESSLLALHGTGPDNIWAGGEDGALFHYDGARWEARDAGTQTVITALWASGPDELWIGAADGLLHQLRGDLQRLPPTGIQALWATGRDLWGVSDRGVIIRYDGVTLSSASPLPNRRLSGVWGSGPGDVWAAGQAGALLHFDGVSWTVVSQSGPTWLAVWGRRQSEVWVAGESASQRFDGTSWQNVAIGNAATLNALWGGRDYGPVAVGSVGTMRRFESGAWNTLYPATSPIGQGEALRAVWGASPAELFAVGTTGRAAGQQLGLIARYDGAVWTRALETPGRLWDLSGRGAVAYAVGDGGAVLRYQEGRWLALPTGVQTALRGVWVPPPGGPDDLWAVGDGGLILRGRGGAFTQVPSTTGRDLQAVWGAAPDDVWAVGQWGAILHYDGRQWRADLGADDLSKATLLRAVWGSSWSDVFVAGDGGLILHRSGGRWVSELSGAREDLRRLWGTGPTDVWAGGGAEPPGRASALLHFDGQSWSRVGTGTGRLALFGLFGSEREDQGGRVFAVGAAGGVLRFRGY